MAYVSAERMKFHVQKSDENLNASRAPLSQRRVQTIERPRNQTGVTGQAFFSDWCRDGVRDRDG